MKKQLLFVAGICAITVCAQEKEGSIQEVTILGRKKIKQERREFSRHAQSVETLSEEELNRNNPAALDQTLTTMAGVQVDKRTAFGGQRIVVRGYGNDQKFNNWGTKFYLNSVPVTTADGVTLLEDIDFSLINAIEVVKGPAATLYGGGVGGVVRFYMRPQTEKGVSVSQKVAAGSFNLFQSGTRVDAVGDSYSVMAAYGHLESDGYRPNGASRKNFYAFKGDFKLNDKQNISIYTSHNNSFEGVSGQISDDDYNNGIDNGNLAYISKNSGNSFLSTRASVMHQWNILPNLNNFTSIYYAGLDAKRVAAGALENSQSPNYGVRSTFMLNNGFSENFSNNLEFGTEYGISRSLLTNYRFTGTNAANPLEVAPLSKGSYFKYNNSALSVFAVDKLTYRPWHLTLVAGVGANKIKYGREDLLALRGLLPDYNKNVSFDKDFETVFTPHFALQKSWKNQIFNLSYSEGFNAPTAASGYITDISKTNDGLLPEKAKMWDLSVQGLLADTRLDYQVSLFNIDITNKLTQLAGNNGNNYQYWANTGRQRNNGMELSVGYKYSGDAFFTRIEPFVNASFYDFKYTDFTTNVNKQPVNFSGSKVVGVPSEKFSAGLDFETKPGFYLFNTLNHVGEVYRDFANTKKMDAYVLLNSKLGYRKAFGQWELDAYLAGNNLTSAKHYTFLFLGNSIGDSDNGSQYPKGVATDINPGPSKAYFFGGLNVKYRF